MPIEISIDEGAAVIKSLDETQGGTIWVNGQSFWQIYLRDEKGNLTDPFYLTDDQWSEICTRLAWHKEPEVILRFKRVEDKNHPNPKGYQVDEELLP